MIAGQIEIQLMADIARLQRDMDRANRVVSSATSQIERAAQAAKNALGAIGVGLGGRELISMIDQYTKFTAQLKLATQSQREYAQAYEAVKGIAKDSQQDLGATGVLYARIANGTRELGTTQKQVAAVTETVNMALKVSGATAAESASAQLQLSQAFASGTLRGEEFNAVNEAAPRLMKALADGMGVSVDALKAMASEGKITTAVMSQALGDERLIATLREEAKQVETIGGSFTLLKNSVIEFVGVQAQASGVVSALTSGISLLAENLALLSGAALTLAAAKLGNVIGTWTVAAHKHVTATYQQVNAAVALRAAAIASAEAEVASTGAKVAQLTTTQAMIVVAREEAMSKLASSNANIASARTAMAAAEAAGAQSFALRTLRIATADLAAAEAMRSAMLAELAILGRQQTAVSAQLTAATTAQATAQAGLNAATTAGIGAAGLASRALGFLGGPIGIVVTLLGVGAMAWSNWGNSAKEENDKALKSTEETTKEMIARLDKQIEKLKERNRLRDDPQVTALGDLNEADKAGLERARLALQRNREAQDKARKDGQQHLLIDMWREEKVLLADYNAVLERTTAHQAELSIATQKTRDKRLADWYAQNGTAAQRMAAELEKLKKEFGSIPPEMEKMVRAKYADKGAATALNQEKTAYQSLVTSIQEKIAANALELSGYDKLTDSQKMAIKLDAEISSGKNKLSADHIKEARAMIDQVAAQEQAIELRKRASELNEAEVKAEADVQTALRAGTAAIDDRINAMQREIDLYGLSETAAIDAERAKLEAKLAAGPATYAELIALDAQIAKLKELAALAGTKASLVANSDVAKAKELLDIMSNLDEVTKQAAQGMADSFGRVGTAIGGLTTALSGYARAQAAIAAQLAAATKDAGGDPAKLHKAAATAAKQSAQAQVRSYGDMASAAKGFFSENSKGYKALEAAEKAFRAAEMVMAMETMAQKIFFKEAEVAANTTLNATKIAGEAAATTASTGLAATEASAWGVTAVVKAIASMPFPANLAAGAATLAAVMAIGAKIIGSLGGGGSTVNAMSAAEAQKAQGTGSVFGSSTDKSASIAKSLDLLEENSDISLPLTQAMLTELRGIHAAIGGLSNLVVRADGIVDGSNFDIATGTISKALGGLWGKTKQEIIDAGIQFGGIVSALQAGIGYQQYANVATTKSSWFGLSKSTKTSTQTAALEAEVAQQFGLVFQSLEKTLVAAAGALGRDGAAVADAVRNMVLQTTTLSLKDLSGDDLQNAINAVISKASDDVAQAVLPGFDAFRQIGEGYAETVLRVATDIEQAGLQLERFGVTAIAYTDILDKQGDVAAEIVRQSILAVENTAGVADIMRTLSGEAADLADTYAQLLDVQTRLRMVGLAVDRLDVSLIRAAGGLDALADGLDAYFENYFTEAEQVAARTEAMRGQFAALGVDMPATLAGFRALVETAPELTGKLLPLAEAFADLMGRIDEAASMEAEAAASLAEQRASLMIELMRAEGREAEALAAERAAELAAMDASLRPIKERIWALQDEAAAMQSVRDAASALLTGVDNAFSALQSVIVREKAAVQTTIDAHTASVTKLQALSQALRSTLDGMRSAEQQLADRSAGQAQIRAALATARAGGGLPDADSLKNALSAVKQDASGQFSSYTAYLRDLYMTQNDITALADITDDQLSIEQKALAAAQQQIKALDSILENAQSQIDVLKGIDKTGLSIQQALQALALAINQAQANPVVGSTAAISSAYQTYLGRTPDAAGLEWWQDRAAAGVPTSAITDAIKNSAEAQVQKLYQDLLGRQADAGGLSYFVKSGASTAEIAAAIKASDEYKAKTQVPGFANGGDFGGGLRMVGEIGPELEVTGPSRIHSTQDLISALRNPSDNSAVLAKAVERLTSMVERQAVAMDEQKTSLQKIQSNTRRQADTLDVVTEGGKGMRTQ